MIDRRGMTLIEVVMAMAIVAMIIAAIFGVLRLARRAEEKGQARIEDTQRVMILADRLSWLLAGAFPYRYFDEEQEAETIAFEGESDWISFVTTSVDKYTGDLADLPGIKHVRLSIGPGGLMAAERMFYMNEADGVEYVLEPNAESMEIEYLEQDAESGETRWVADWDSETRDYMPRAVAIRVTLLLGEREVEVPPVVVSLQAGGAEGLSVPLPRLP